MALVLLATVFFGGTGATYVLWNDEAIGATISHWVSDGIRGRGGPRAQAFTIGRAHWPYWGGLRSVLFGGTVDFEARDVGIWDAEGGEVLFAPRVRGKLHAGRLVWHEVLSLLPFRHFDLQLHFADVEIESPRCRIGEISTGQVNIVSAFLPKKPHPATRGGMVISVDEARLHDARFAMGFPGWHAEVERFEADVAKLRYSSFHEEQAAAAPAFTYSVSRIAAPAGRLALGEAWEFPIKDLLATRFAALDPERQHLRFHATAETRGGHVQADGRLTDTYSDHPGVDMRLDFEHGGGLLAMLGAGELLGGDPHGHVRFHGPFAGVQIDGVAEGGEFRVADLTARNVRTDFALEGSHVLLSGIDSDLGGGHVRGGVDIDLGKLAWKAQLRSEGVDPAQLTPLVPKAARPTLAGRLDGSARLAGSFVSQPDHVRVQDIEARLLRRVRDKLPRSVDLRGGLQLSPSRIGLVDFNVAGDGVSARLHGRIDPSRRTVDSDITVEGRSLGRLLTRFDAPPALESLHASGHVSGALLQPLIEADARLTGVGLGDRRLDEVTARVRFARGQLSATSLRGNGFGGRIEGQVDIGLFDGPFTRRLAEPTIKLHVAAERLHLHQLLALPAVHGEITGQFDAGGTLSRPQGFAQLDIPVISIYGDAYRNGVLRASIDETGLGIERMELERADGGRFSISQRGHVGWDRSLDVDVRPSDFPLRAIPQLRDVPFAIDGVLSGAVHIGGALGAWIPEGVIEVAKVKVREVPFGDGRLKIDPIGRRVRLSGVFFDRFQVDGSISLDPTALAGDLTIRFAGFPLEGLIPELKQLAEVRSRATGYAHLDFDLNAGRTAAELHLTQLLLTFAEGEDAIPGASHGDQLVNEGDVVITSDGKDIRFESFRMRYEGLVGKRLSRIGQLQVAGVLAAEHSDLTVTGKLDLRLLEYFATSLFEHTHGQATADLHLTGRMAHPMITGRLDLQDAGLEPRGADRPFRVPTGQLRFDETGVYLSRLRMQLDGAEAVAEGRMDIDWANSKLGRVLLDVNGELSASLLAWFFPDHVSDPTGRFGVRLRIAGQALDPSWDGKVDVRDVAFHLKRMGRDVELPSGTARMRGFELLVGCPPAAGVEGCRSLKAIIDKRSVLQLDGTVGLRGGLLSPELGTVALRVDGNDIELGSPGVFSLSVSPRLRLQGTGEQLRLTGRVDIVNGRYSQDFDVLRDLAIQPRTVDADEPFYAGIPLLEELALDLTVSASGPLFIKDNLADLNLMMNSLRITGTLSEPILDGIVYVEPGGRFRLPLVRAEFISQSGTITFEEQKVFPEDTPRLDIHAYTDWTDRYDQVHHIDLRLLGTYKEPDLFLTSSDGWDKSRVLAALVTGVTPDDLRRAGERSGRRGASPSDGYIKTLTGRALRPIEDPLREVTRFDLVRIELGYDSAFIKLCPYNRAAVKLCGTGDLGFVSTTRYDAKGVLKITDILSTEAAVEHIENGLDTSQNVVNRFRFQLSLRLPIY